MHLNDNFKFALKAASSVSMYLPLCRLNEKLTSKVIKSYAMRLFYAHATAENACNFCIVHVYVEQCP